MLLTWEITGTIFGIAAVLGGAAFRWVTGGIAAEALAREKLGDTLSEKIEDETAALERKLDHKHNNVATQFQAVNHRLDSNCEKIDSLTRETVRLSEGLRSQEMQTREIKLEFKESMSELKSDMGKRFDTLERFLRGRAED